MYPIKKCKIVKEAEYNVIERTTGTDLDSTCRSRLCVNRKREREREREREKKVDLEILILVERAMHLWVDLDLLF